MSLQMVRGEGYNQGTDIWSLGVAAYLMLFGEFPFGRCARTSDQMKKAIAKGEPAVYRPMDVNLPKPSPAAIAFARGLMVRQPLQRPSAEKALELPFVAQSALVAAPSGTEVDASTQFELQPAALNAQKLTSKLKTKPTVNPIVQRDLDELLRRLQAKHKSEVAAGAPRLTRSFSGEAQNTAPGNAWNSSDEDGLAKEGRDTPMLARSRFKRSSTHTGFTPNTTLDSLPPLACRAQEPADDDDDDGEKSVSSVASDSTATGGVGFFDARSNCTASQVATLDSLPPLEMPSEPEVPKWSGAEGHNLFLAPSILRIT